MGAVPHRNVKSYAPMPKGILRRASGALKELQRTREARERFLVLAGEIGLMRANELLRALEAR